MIRKLSVLLLGFLCACGGGAVTSPLEDNTNVGDKLETKVDLTKCEEDEIRIGGGCAHIDTIIEPEIYQAAVAIMATCDFPREQPTLVIEADTEIIGWCEENP